MSHKQAMSLISSQYIIVGTYNASACLCQYVTKYIFLIDIQLFVTKTFLTKFLCTLFLWFRNIILFIVTDSILGAYSETTVVTQNGDRCIQLHPQIVLILSMSLSETYFFCAHMLHKMPKSLNYVRSLCNSVSRL